MIAAKVEAILFNMGVPLAHVDIPDARSKIPLFDAFVIAVEFGMAGDPLNALADVATDALMRAYGGGRKDTATAVVADRYEANTGNYDRVVVAISV